MTVQWIKDILRNLQNHKLIFLKIRKFFQSMQKPCILDTIMLNLNVLYIF